VRLIVVSGNVVELNYMWLPTWLGQNAAFKQRMEADVKGRVEGLELTESNLDRIDRLVLNYIVDQFPHVRGLFDYLDGLKFIELTEPNGG